ncbi:MAG: DUF6198 family protein [Methanosphaera sp.]|nr:DUF6198 family protein [Methanosphaera sp.]
MNNFLKKYLQIDLYNTDFKEVIRKYMILLVGLFIMSLGVSLSINSGLGTSPISCVPYVLSLYFPVSVGTTTVVFNALLVLLQIIILRSRFPRIQILQVFVGLFFGYFIDITSMLISGFIPTSYVSQWLYCILGCVVLAFGVLIEVKADALVLPGEGVSLAVRSVTNVEFGKIKTVFDTSNVVLGVILTLAFFGEFRGVGLGSIFAMIAVGSLVRLYKRIINKLTGTNSI